MSLASAILLAPPSAAQPAQDPVAGAVAQYFDGKAVSAREMLIRRLEGPEAREPGARLATLGVLLDICIHSDADACVTTYGPQYAELAKDAPAANAVLKAEQARRAAYYFDQARFRLGRPEVTAQILEWDVWRRENASNGELYLQRRLLAADVLLAQGKPDAALAEVDRILSLIATLKTPQAARFTVACALTEVIRTLLDLGQTERAFGLYAASRDFIAATLAPRSVDAAVFRLAEAQVLEGVGDVDGVARALATARDILRETELDEGVRGGLAGQVMSLQAAVCGLKGDMDCARGAMREHPAAALYRQAGRAPGSQDELTYLAARALVASLDGTADPIAAQALSGPLGFTPDGRRAEAAGVLRAAGRALTLPPGADRQAAFANLGQRIRQGGLSRAGASAGSWYRPSVTDLLMITLALSAQTQAPAGDADTTFALFQLAGRAGPSFDADALTVLGQAHDALERRTIHEALRLRARRDRLERDQIAAVVARAAGPPGGAGGLEHDIAARQAFRDYARRIAAANGELARGGLALSGANVAPLRRLQVVLAPDEAALITAPVAGGMAYMCVRRDTTFLAHAPMDAARLKVDTRLLQAALSATYDPSDELDSQFPVAAAMRTYDALVRPFTPCLKPGDRLVWLSGVASAGLPLAALLSSAPETRGQGYDLATAHWLVRDHATAYAGSASALVAARSGTAGAAAFDFLGIGDPLLTGQTEDGQSRGEAVLASVRAGARFGGLAPLPETKDELEASARGFRQPRLLTEGAASEAGFRAELTGAYRFLSFATHGLLREELPGLPEPALVLTPVSVRDPSDDGLLTASEIADLNLSARFAALSACNTANFDMAQMAQDLPALASAFAVAGVPATLGTLWPVDSRTGQAVVAATFGELRGRPERGPAEALAIAQRAFLAAPPSRAHLHPRFWAPFVVLGDGGATAAGPAASGTPNVTSIEVLTARGGEVLDVRRGAAGVAARFIGERDASGRATAGLRVAGTPSWRRDTAGVAAARFALQLGATVIAAGTGYGPQGAIAPTLEAFDAASGASIGTWRGDQAEMAGAGVFGGVQSAPGAALVVVGQARGAGAGPWLKVLEVDASLAPRVLLETRAPAGVDLDHATVAVVGGDVMLTYTQAYRRVADPPLGDDDYDTVACGAEPVTWVEVRDGRTGALKVTRELRGVRVHAALGRGRDVLLGGGARTGCDGQTRAVVLAVNAAGRSRPVYADASLGESMVWTLAALPEGRTFVAASKLTETEYAPARGAGVDPARLEQKLRGVGGMLLVLGPEGRPSPVRVLDSGGPVFLNGADASRAGDVLLGGSLGGQAAIFHLDARELVSSR